DNGGHTGEVLHQDARRGEGDLPVALAAVPVGQGGNVVGQYRDSVLVTEQVLEQDLQGVRQAADVVARGQRIQPEDLVVLPGDRQPAPGTEAAGPVSTCVNAHPTILPLLGTAAVRA